MPKVLYFIAGDKPTSGELAAIAAIPVLSVQVRNAAKGGVYGAAIEPCDYVAGSPPSPAYDAVPVYSPNIAIASTQAIVSTAQVIPLDGGGTVTLTIAGNVITSAVYTAP